VKSGLESISDGEEQVSSIIEALAIPKMTTLLLSHVALKTFNFSFGLSYIAS
jgi:hypothetical protein